MVEDHEVEQARLAVAPLPSPSASIVPSEMPPRSPVKGAARLRRVLEDDEDIQAGFAPGFVRQA